MCLAAIAPAAEERVAINEKSAGDNICSLKTNSKQARKSAAFPYKLGKTLGKGQFGLVRAGTHKETGKKVAVKVVKKQCFDPEEIRLQYHLDHNNIIRVHEMFEIADMIYIVMDFSCGGNLFEYLVGQKRIHEGQARRLFQQVVDAIEHCHANKVAHRDIKLENILLDESNNVKLADFGLSVEMPSDEYLTRPCGSPDYMAPELLHEDCHYKGTEVDVWACGVVLFALLTSHLPFTGDSRQSLFQNIETGACQLPDYLSDDAKDILAKMLEADVQKRISISEIRKHVWLANQTAPHCCLMRSDSQPFEYGKAILESGDISDVSTAASG
jgi:serine/threonine protein kinase